MKNRTRLVDRAVERCADGLLALQLNTLFAAGH